MPLRSAWAETQLLDRLYWHGEWDELHGTRRAMLADWRRHTDA